MLTKEQVMINAISSVIGAVACAGLFVVIDRPFSVLDVVFSVVSCFCALSTYDVAVNFIRGTRC